MRQQLTTMRPRKELAEPLTPRLGSVRPVKQKRALLKSNPLRDNWIEGDEITVSTFGEAKTSPKQKSGEGLFQSRACLENFECRGGCSGAVSSKKSKTPLASVRFFEAIPKRHRQEKRGNH